jgi:hypothetical protein
MQNLYLAFCVISISEEPLELGMQNFLRHEVFMSMKIKVDVDLAQGVGHVWDFGKHSNELSGSIKGGDLWIL